MKYLQICILLGLAGIGLPGADEPGKRAPVDALRPFNDLIGSWRGAGTPEGTRAEQQRGFWLESISWTWNFKDKDAALKAAITKGKHFTSAELRFLPDKDRYRLTLTTPAKQELQFVGSLKDNVLTVERNDETKKETQRIVLSMFHGTRFIYRFEVKPEGRASFAKLYSVGCTKEGVAFAGPGDNSPECVVSGGLGKIKVTYKGETYYVCCTGCQEAFKDDPEKYLKEYAARKAKEAKEKGH
jgi:YHS domain-containing protein